MTFSAECRVCTLGIAGDAGRVARWSAVHVELPALEGQVLEMVKGAREAVRIEAQGHEIVVLHVPEIDPRPAGRDLHR